MCVTFAYADNVNVNQIDEEDASSHSTGLKFFNNVSFNRFTGLTGNQRYLTVFGTDKHLQSKILNV